MPDHIDMAVGSDHGSFQAARSEAGNYYGLQHQTFQVNLVATASKLSGTSNQDLWDGGWQDTGVDLEPANGDMDYDDVAELVALEVDYMALRVRQESGTGTTPGNAYVECTWGTSESGGYDPIVQNQSPQVGGLSSGSAATMDVFKSQNDDAQLLQMHVDTLQPHNDTANGSGSGGQQSVRQDIYRNYRHRYGQGPLFDRDDFPSFVPNFRTSQIQNEDLVFTTFFRFVWDVYDRDNAIRNE